MQKKKTYYEPVHQLIMTPQKWLPPAIISRMTLSQLLFTNKYWLPPKNNHSHEKLKRIDIFPLKKYSKKAIIQLFERLNFECSKRQIASIF